MIVDGRAIASDLYASLLERRVAINRPLTLGILVCGANPVIESFVRIKRLAAERLDIRIERFDLPEHAGTEDAVHAVGDLAARVDALIVQLPLPKEFDTDAVLGKIPKEKDVDGINPAVSLDQRLVNAPVALAVAEILQRSGVETAGKKILVVGEGRLVGKPVAEWLRRQLVHPTVVTDSINYERHVRDADILIMGTGNPGLVKPEHIQDGVVIIDAGTSEQDGVIRGDADPACAEKASVFTPVPGGVGPIAVAMIFKNLLDLVERSK